MIDAIQFEESCRTEQEAGEVVRFLAIQDGLIGIRLLPPGPGKPHWRVYAYFDCNGEENGWLPDGCRHVLLPLTMNQRLREAQAAGSFLGR